MLRQIASVLLLGAPLMAGAATVPSDLMRPAPEQAVQGYAVNWLLKIELESDQMKDIEPCRKILAERGFYPMLSKTASSASPLLHFKIAGVKQYEQADVDADEALAAVMKAACPATLTWTVESKHRPQAR
ncbi:hypothetical protein Jab_1c16290 [Janthinobacterium sp. HH01]|uniref:hypothetical protein n=1 Tax=Janthinobacterium sp. HH01 TaxID=1198452 RepID=UPI0002AEAD67|nr:hypothetical protein [Janthinobacterium sp. HH01]ELX13010.1 hypothetical protein Jab_1c16290 [Janthinobacterium sp. HH01]